MAAFVETNEAVTASRHPSLLRRISASMINDASNLVICSEDPRRRVSDRFLMSSSLVFVCFSCPVLFVSQLSSAIFPSYGSAEGQLPTCFGLDSAQDFDQITFQSRGFAEWSAISGEPSLWGLQSDCLGRLNNRTLRGCSIRIDVFGLAHNAHTLHRIPSFAIHEPHRLSHEQENRDDRVSGL